MSVDDKAREEQIAEEQEQDWPWGAWTETALARLWEEAGSEGPWQDAGPESKSSSEGEVPGNDGRAA